MLSSQEEQEERRRVLAQDARVREQQGSTFHTFAQADADIPGRFSAVAHATVVGADPIPNYPAAAAHQHDPCGLEPPIGYRIDAMPDPEEPSTVHHAAVEQTGEPPSASPLSRGSPLSSGDLTSDGDAPSSQLDVQRAEVGSPPLNKFRRRRV